MRLRVVQLITGLEVGGAERLLLNTLRHLSPEQFECHVVCLYNNGSIGREIETLGIPVTDVRMRSLSDLSGVLRLLKILKRLQPQILHTHLFRSNLWGRLVGASLRIPIMISSEHSLTRTHFEGRLRIKWITWIDTALSRLSDTVIAVSESTRDLLRENGVASDKIVFIPNAIDTTLYLNQDGTSIRREFQLDHVKVVTAVGRLVSQKNHRLLIEAFSTVLERFRHAKLLIVGSGPLRSELEARVPESMRDNVLFLGTRSDIPQIMAASDVVVLPSSYEPFGLVLVEAMAASRPVIGTRVDGIPELIDDGINGIVVPPHDSVALSNAILSILSDDIGARLMGAAGQRKSARFDIRTNVDSLSKLYLRMYANYELAATIRHRSL